MRQNEFRAGCKGDYEYESEHERKKRSRIERERKWRKQMRHPRVAEIDDRFAPLIPRRFQA